MGLLSIIGGVLGSVIPGVGTTIGAAIGGGLDALTGKKSSSSSSTPVGPSESTSTTVLNSKLASKTDRVTLTNDTKVAKAAKITSPKFKSEEEDDPWANTRDWYTSLGGDPENVKGINSQDLPY
jgi:hypothetical protein